jgi:putative restriction endonuclease
MSGSRRYFAGARTIEISNSQLSQRRVRRFMSRIFGAIPGFIEGHVFPSRKELSEAGVHRPLQAGISGGETEGADSIVLSGGYEDDEDYGDLIIYTGHGGRDPDTNQQTSDQLLTRGNLALVKNCISGLPVRVVRGFSHRSPYSPKFGYRYDGLFRVDSFWRAHGRAGHIIFRFRLIKFSDPVISQMITPSRQKALRESPEPYEVAQRRAMIVQRIVRDTAMAQYVKELYQYHCQVCGLRLETSGGPYAEAAHIRPLGAPHNGPDSTDNILCLCPNHHVLFDYGAFTILDDLTLVGIPGRLIMAQDHPLDPEHLRYHRAHFYDSI